MQDQRLGDLGADAAQRIQRGHRLLEHHGDPVAAQAAHRLFAQAHEFPPLEADRAADPRALRRKSHQRKRRHRLSGAGFADDPEAFAFAEAEARAVDDPDGAALPRQVDDEVSSPRAASLGPRLEPGVERVAQTVAQKVEAEHAERDGGAGIDRQMRRIVEHILRVGQHPPP